MSGRGFRVFKITWLAGLLGALALVLGPPALAAQQVGAQTGQAQGGFGATACNAHGNLRFDRCFCDPGWIGAQCERPEPPPNCGDHGAASNGRCRCAPGWTGRSCEKPPPACVNGKLAHGKCVCDQGWSGNACDVRH